MISDRLSILEREILVDHRLTQFALLYQVFDLIKNPLLLLKK